MPSKNNLTLAILLLSAFCFSLCGFSLQFICAVAISEIVQDYILAQSLAIGFFVLGIGLGSWGFSNPERRTMFRLVSYELIVTGIGAVAPLLFYCIHLIWKVYLFELSESHFSAGFAYGLVVGSLQAVPFAIGFFTGAEIPAITSRCRQLHGRGLGWTLTASYFGALGGALITQTYLVPSFDLDGAAILLAGGNLVAAGLIWLLDFPNLSRINAVLLVSFTGVLLLISSNYLEIRSVYLKALYATPKMTGFDFNQIRMAHQTLKHLGPVNRIRTPYQVIDILDDSFNEEFDPESGIKVFLNRKLQFDSRAEKIYHESMAHLPINLLGRAFERALILGGGDGLLARELLKYGEDAGPIDLVELDPKMIELSRRYSRIARLNNHSLDDPKVKVILGDAFSFVREAEQIYDLVFLDFPYPDSYDLSKLYSVEFYSRVAKVIKPGGLIVLDFPFELPEEERDGRPRSQDVVASTLKAAGFQSLWIFGAVERLMVASVQPRDFNLDYDVLPPFISNQSALNFPGVENETRQLRIDPALVNTINRPAKFLAEGRNL